MSLGSAAFYIKEHEIPACHIREYPRATVDDQEDVLRLAVKQYTPREATKVGNLVTVIGAHANGFPKELYEPLWDDLYRALRAKNVGIRSIWVADAAHQGASGVLNEEMLGNDPSWYDHSRDLFLMVNHFRQHMKRPIIGIGHSFGGTTLVNLSLMHPRLFTSLVLMDPVLPRTFNPRGNGGPTIASTNRRDLWPSRKAAEEAVKRSKFYSAWDPRVRDLWIKYGLRDLPTLLYPQIKAALATPPALGPDGSTSTIDRTRSTEIPVTLTTTKHQEVSTFMRANFPTTEYPNPETNPDPVTHPDFDPQVGPDMIFYRPEPMATFKRLPYLRPSVLFVFGELSDLSSPILRWDTMAQTGIGIGGSGGMKKGRVSEHTVNGVGHLIPMEAVVESANESAAWLAREIDRWRMNEDKERREWAAVPREQRSRLSEEYVQRMNSGWIQIPDRAAKSTTNPKL